MTACNACASRSAAFTMRNPTPGKSAASSPSKDCAASPSSTQGATVATCDQKRANRTRQISSATVTAPPPSPPSTDTPLRMHLTIHRTGGAGAPGDVRADGNAPQAIPMRALMRQLARQGGQTYRGYLGSSGRPDAGAGLWL